MKGARREMRVKVVYSKVTDSWWLTDGKGHFFLECPTEAEAREMAEDWGWC